MPLDETPDTDTDTVAPSEPKQPFPADAARRELNWDELTDSQKIERLRGVVKLLDKALAQERETQQKLIETIAQHGHDPAGRIVVPIRGADLNVVPRQDRESRIFVSNWF